MKWSTTNLKSVSSTSLQSDTQTWGIFLSPYPSAPSEFKKISRMLEAFEEQWCLGLQMTGQGLQQHFIPLLSNQSAKLGAIGGRPETPVADSSDIAGTLKR